jgi:acetyltransferase-like isoleucine patch superfamily enzyme
MIRKTLNLAVNTVRLYRDPVRFFRGKGVQIGDDVEIFGANLFTFGSEPYLVAIGADVTISHGVDFITHDGGMRIARTQYPNAYLYGRIHVGNGCFIGAHCILLLGAKIGDRSIIGSGSIVTGEIPPGVVAVGRPARPIKSVDEYIQEKRHLWIDTGGLTPGAKERLLRSRLPE